MHLFKSIFVIILVIGILWISRVLLQRVKQSPSTRAVKHQETVKCLVCNTYIAQKDAIIKDDKTFCSQQHMKDWNQSA